MNTSKKGKNIMLVNFKLDKKIVKVLDQLVETGLYKTRVDVILSALRNYKPFQEKWKTTSHDYAKKEDESKNNLRK